MDLISKITNKDSTWMPNKEKTLCDQFSQNVQDSYLRKHLKQIVRAQSHIPFLDLREEAIMWSEEEEYKDKRYNTKMKSETTDTVPEEPTADVCASKDKTDTSSEQSDKFNQLLADRLVGKWPTVSAYVAGFKVNCLVDTGSTVTTVTESFYNRFLRRCTDLQTDITFNLKGANGSCIPYIGYVEVDIDIMGQRLPNRGVLIVKDPIDSYTRMRKENVPGLLGMNVISLCKKLLQEDCGN
ncbi:uncharacterized protein LOC134688069 [Mytilus trossulus]|uniref:uncharacterized protein LOC134688069 n=1 Tax=Mytilus trossulus TaxID=6551 RepID=UPI00300516DC